VTFSDFSLISASFFFLSNKVETLMKHFFIPIELFIPMELSSSCEAVSHSATPKFPNILTSLKVHHSAHNSPSMVLILKPD
jgi:hypothetical protein